VLSHTAAIQLGGIFKESIMQTSIRLDIQKALPANHQLHPALINFSALPDEGFVPLPVVCALWSCSPATIWRRVRQGQLVAPHRLGSRTTRWRVGELRLALAGEGK